MWSLIIYETIRLSCRSRIALKWTLWTSVSSYHLNSVTSVSHFTFSFGAWKSRPSTFSATYCGLDALRVHPQFRYLIVDLSTPSLLAASPCDSLPDSISFITFYLTADDIFSLLIQRCSLYSFQCFYFTVRYIGSISEPLSCSFASMHFLSHKNQDSFHPSASVRTLMLTSCPL